MYSADTKRSTKFMTNYTNRDYSNYTEKKISKFTNKTVRKLLISHGGVLRHNIDYRRPVVHTEFVFGADCDNNNFNVITLCLDVKYERVILWTKDYISHLT